MRALTQPSFAITGTPIETMSAAVFADTKNGLAMAAEAQIRILSTSPQGAAHKLDQS